MCVLLFIPFLSSRYPHTTTPPKPFFSLSLRNLMSGLTRLRSIFSAKPKPKPKPKPAIKTHPPNPFHKYDYSTPEGIRKDVDNFKRSCNSANFRRGIPFYHAIVNRLAQAQAFPMIEEILEYQKQYKEISDERFVGRLILLYGKAGMVDHARALFDEMPSFNSPRTVKSFSVLLHAHIVAKRCDVVQDLFRQLPSRYSIQPDVVSYNIVIQALCEMGSTDSALAMLSEMEELGLKPNHNTFTPLLGGFYEKHGYTEGEKIWALMKARDDMYPDAACYAKRMSGMVMDGRVTEAVKLVDEMRLNGVQPNVDCFNVLIKSFCKDGNLEEAKYWYDELARNCAADRNTYETLVPLLVEKGDFEMALKLCKNAMSGRKLLIDVEVLKRVVEGFVNDRRIGEAKELVDFAKNSKFKLHLSLKLEVESA